MIGPVNIGEHLQSQGHKHALTDDEFVLTNDHWLDLQAVLSGIQIFYTFR